MSPVDLGWGGVPIPDQLPLLSEHPGETGTAVLSDDGLYRYHLSRWLGGTLPPVLFVMLNPSTADARINDPTLSKCMGFGVRQNARAVHIVNLFAYRATDPADLWSQPATDRVGPDNDDHLRTTFRTARNGRWTVIAGWGAHKPARARADVVYRMGDEAGLSWNALRLTKSGEPGHPLMLPYNLRPSSHTRVFRPT